MRFLLELCHVKPVIGIKREGDCVLLCRQTLSGGTKRRADLPQRLGEDAVVMEDK